MVVDIIGISGAAIILIAFVMNQLHKWKDTDLIYDASNALGSLLLIVYSYYLNSVPFIILNTVWFAVSAKDVFLKLK
jgi:hypothetical protein